MSHYDSDGSTLVNGNEQHRRNERNRRHRTPSPSQERYYPRASQSYYPNEYAYANGNVKGDAKSKYVTIGKVAVVVGVVGVLLHKWQKDRIAEREREERRERRRRRKDFEKAKRSRRREEERREREEEEWVEPQSPQPEMRRIEYRPMERTESRESSGSDVNRGRRIDAATETAGGRGRGGERVYEGDRAARSRYRD